MAVCTNELTLRDLLQDGPTTAPATQPAEIATSCLSGKMIPLHRGRVKPSSAVAARPVLESLIPLDEDPAPYVLLAYPQPRVATVIRSVVRLPTRLAPGLVPTPGTAMEFRLGLVRPTASAQLSLVHVAIMDTRSDELVVAPGNPATLRAAANTSRGFVLGRPDTSRYRDSLRPSPARFSPANHAGISRSDH